MTKLNLGAGQIELPGFIPLGRDHGTEIFPLHYPDESVDEIYASHVLEHFGTRDVATVLADWVRALKKGGRIRIAVPDFEVIAKKAAAGEPAPYEGWLMGGQIDSNDFHKSMFTFEKLRLLLAGLDLVLVRRWQAEIDDCSALDISLNLEGFKPHVKELKVSGAVSVPRLGFMDNFFCAMEACLQCGVKFSKHGNSPFWGQSMTNVVEHLIKEDKPDVIATMDYDSIFKPAHLARLVQTMMLYPHVDALAPLQSSRHLTTSLFSIKDAQGEARPRIPRKEFVDEISRVSTAHFGLTLLRTAAIQKLKKPWFHAVPSPTGDWHVGDGHLDEDIAFWRGWEDAGNSLYLANRVAIGHAELMVRWPDKNLEVFYQPMHDWQTQGVPEEVWI